MTGHQNQRQVTMLLKQSFMGLQDHFLFAWMRTTCDPNSLAKLPVILELSTSRIDVGGKLKVELHASRHAQDLTFNA